MATLTDIREAKYLNGWTVTADADNAGAVATKAASPGQTHYITGVLVSFTASAGAIMAIKDGSSTVMVQQKIYDKAEITFSTPLKGTSGNAVSVELGASGVSGNVGLINMIGFTI